MKNKILLIPGSFLTFYSIGAGLVAIGSILSYPDEDSLNAERAAYATLAISTTISSCALAYQLENAAYLLLNGAPLLIGPISNLFRTQK